jgi:hypothetical protein
MDLRLLHRVHTTTRLPLSGIWVRCIIHAYARRFIVICTPLTLYHGIFFHNQGLYWTAPFLKNALFQDHSFDTIIIPGDISYADGNEAHWDKYMLRMQSLYSRIPLMVCPGNHETKDEHSVMEDEFYGAYLSRFTTDILARNSASPSPLYYSADIAGVHFIFVNTEFDRNSFAPGQPQYSWVAVDLEAAARRRWLQPALYPWIVVIEHRAMYSSTVARTCLLLLFLISLICYYVYFII